MFRGIGFYVFAASIVWALIVYGCVVAIYSGETTRTIRLTQIYALTAVFFLYFALLAGPLTFVLRKFPYREQYLKARRSLAVSAFYFGFLHAYLAFFGQLGGFEGLAFLSDKYLLAIILSFTAFIILFSFTVTSFGSLAKKLPFVVLKLLNGVLYLAAILILIHALMLGTHFVNLSDLIPQIFFSALVVLAILEAMRFDSFLRNKFSRTPSFGVTSTVVIGFFAVAYVFSLLPDGTELPIGIHAQHIQSANEAQHAADSTPVTANIPGMDGDKTKRYTTSFLHPDSVEPNQETELVFKVFDASSGNRVEYFKTIYEKPVHMIVVDSTLTYFNHIHPEVTDDGFVIATQFPAAGEYRIYLDFQPLGAIEQQMAFTLKVGTDDTIRKSDAVPDKDFTKTYDNYQVSLDFPKPLIAQQLSVGKQTFTFTITDTAGEPVTTLKPYLGAFGHLVMIKNDTYEYIHVHPADLTPPKPDENGGPAVEFMPLGLYGPIKPGIYRVFGQFNPDGELFTSDFTVEVK